jgi:hypothetical protein
MCVEPCRQQNGVGHEAVEGWHNDVTIGLHERLITALGWHGDVECAANPSIDAHLIACPAAGVEGPTMARDVQDVRVCCKNIVGTVPVVHIYVDNRDTP